MVYKKTAVKTLPQQETFVVNFRSTYSRPQLLLSSLLRSAFVHSNFNLMNSRVSINNEKRHHTRITLGGEIDFKMAGSAEQQRGHCKSISGAGVSFICQKAISPGKAAEIHLDKGSFGSPITAFVEIIRCTPLSDHNHFEIAAAIKGIKGC